MQMGELTEELFATRRYCSEKGREGGKKTQKGVRREVCVRVKTFSPSAFGLSPLESGCEEGTVSITKIK